MPSSPNGPCSSGKTTSTSPSARGGCPGSCTVSARSVVLERHDDRRRRSPSTSGSVARRRARSRAGLVGDEHPAAVLGDADRARRRSASRSIAAQHAGRGHARDGVLAGAAAEDDGDAGLAAGRARARGVSRCSSPATLSPADPARRRTRAGAAPSLRAWTTCTPTTVAPASIRSSRRPPAARARRRRQRAAGAGLDVRRRRRRSNYGRDGNPTWTAFEEALGALEGGDALVFASGMAAVAAVLTWSPHGGKRRGAARTPTTARSCCSPTSRQRGRADACALVDIDDTAAVARRLRRRRLLWLESPTNPMLEVADLPALVAAAPRARARSSSSTTPSPPPCSSSRSTLGADVVRALGDQVPRRALRRPPRRRRHRGHRRRPRAARAAARAPADPRRDRRADGGLAGAARPAHPAPAGRARQANAAELARRLADHPAVERVRYPGLRRDRRRSRCAGGARGPPSAVASPRPGCGCTPPASAASSRRSSGGAGTPPSRRRCPEGLVRLSVGIEDVEDLWGDLATPWRWRSGPARLRPAPVAPAGGLRSSSALRAARACSALDAPLAGWRRRARPRRPARRSARRRRGRWASSRIDSQDFTPSAVCRVDGDRPPRASCPGRASRRRCGCATAATCRWRRGRRARPARRRSPGRRRARRRAGRSRPARG